MSALRDRVLNSPLDELVWQAERGEIDPDELWAEVLESIDRSAGVLRDINRKFEVATEPVANAELRRKQDRIDAMIREWRSELDAAGLLDASQEPQADKASRASRGG